MVSIGDTIINGETYRQIVNPDQGPITYFLREDVQQRKVYHYNQYYGDEYVLYDFSLDLGDEFIYQENPNPFVVTEKELISSPLGDLYKWKLENNGSPPITYIEAIGAVDYFLVYSPFISDPVYRLNQVFSNCVEVFCNNNISCIDENPFANPALQEIYGNGIDDDCDPNTLDDDFDQDGFGPDDDCDDENPNINPGQVEIAFNGIDDDCNPNTLDDDLDQDGFSAEDDCDDENSEINPGQAEIVYNGLDDDCDPSTFDDDLDQDGFASANDCDDNDPAINPDQAEIVYNGIDDDCDPSTLDDDLDQDGFASANDCDDTNPAINPDQTEIIYNGIDDDCDPTSLDDDLDQDGFNIDEDCNDENANINPDAEEIANNEVDEDCDGVDLLSSIDDLSESIFEIYPNPVVDVINIINDRGLDFKASIYNASGVLINSHFNPKVIEISSLSQGVYFISLMDLSNGNIYTKKLLII